MTKHYEKHAAELIEAFQEMLSADARAALTDEHLEELSMMIEAAISTAVLQQLEAAADEVSGLASSLRRRAEKFESTR